MGSSLIQRAFAGGELAPGLGMRADLARYTQALRTCRNFLVRRSGGVANRPGFAFVAETRTTDPSVLFPFVFAAADQSFVIEAGAGYFRFHHRGAPVHVTDPVPYVAGTYAAGDVVEDGGILYWARVETTTAPPGAHWHTMDSTLLEIPTPYVLAALFPPAPLYWHQAGSLVTLTHLDYPPMELRYRSQTRWALTFVTVAPSIYQPADLIATPGVAGTRTYSYVVTALKADTYEESVASAPVDMPLAGEPTPELPHVLTWAIGDPNSAEYNIYQDLAQNGTFGYLGTSNGGYTLFNDIGQTADMAFTPPVYRPLFHEPLLYPAVSAVHGQRRYFAGTHTFRDEVFGSRVGAPSNFTIRSPIQDDDAIRFRTVTKELQAIVHLVSLKQLVMLTDRGEWVIQGDADGVVMPTHINPLQHGYVGTSWVVPVVYGERILFVQARGNVLRELGFAQQVDGLTGRDLTIMSGHLFRSYQIVSMAFALVPDAVLWAVRDDGVLLGCTYIPDEDVLAWHRHDTLDGRFESVCTIPEGDEDAVYVIVERDTDEGTFRYVERLATRDWGVLADAVFVDAAVEAEVTGATLAGLTHLRGRAVRVTLDGVPVPGLRTVSAAGTIPVPPVIGAHVVAGLPITADLESLDLDVGGTDVRDKRKKVTALALQLEESVVGFEAGPDVDHLRPVSLPAWATGDPLYTGRVELSPVAYFNDVGRVFVRHTAASPLTVLGLLPVVDVGG